MGRTPTQREISNAILYVNRTGIAWRYLPHDFRPHVTVYGYFALWIKEGIFTELNYTLTGLVRDHHGRTTEPTASINGHPGCRSFHQRAPRDPGHQRRQEDRRP